MLYRDVSAITSDNNSCNYINSEQIIYGFSNSNRTRKTYILLEDKYYLTNTTTQTNAYNISTYTCLSSTELQTLPSTANFYLPFYSSIAISLSILVLFIVWFSIKSILGRRV